MWTNVQLILGIMAILLVFGGDKLSMPLIRNAGLAFFGLTAMAIGWEAIITQHVKFGSRRKGTRQTYTGLPAILHGVQFNLLGLFLIVIAIMIYFNVNGRAVFLQMVRRPGLPLIVFGMLFLIQAVIMLTGSRELKQGERGIVILNLMVSRLLPGSILVVLGMGAMWLGVFEIIAPDTFDEMGGGFLEVLYGLR